MIKPGYSYATVTANAAYYVSTGATTASAWRSAMAYARQCYRSKYPSAGMYPSGIIARGQSQQYKFYGRDGYLLRAGRGVTENATAYRKASNHVTPKNPVRPLAITAAEKRELANAVSTEFSGVGADVRRAAELFADFTGHDPQLQKVSVPDSPGVLMNFGKCDAILYSTVRDGTKEKYRHEFKPTARPFVCVSPDGKQIFLLGGSFRFTERGIEDFK